MGLNNKKNGKIDANKEEIKELFNIISKQLDALSHFHYTPKPVVNDMNIISIKNNNNDMKSILIENINPTNESDANALAPEDIYKKKKGRKAALKSDAEYDRDDKKRLRSATKAKNRKEKKQKNIDDTMKAKADSTSKEARKLESKAIDDIMKTDKRIIQGKHSDSTSYNNSTSFFTKVQNQK
jgi:U3 small nucleolar RNA-associated protein MPP10